MSLVDLRLTHANGYRPGRPFPVRVLWHFVEIATLLNPLLTSYGVKRGVLRLFGARVGANVIVKPLVHVKYPWRLVVGDNSWIGERAWIDNMEDVVIGANVVVSQGAYLCTGNHDWADPGMPLAPRSIFVGDGAWIGAMSRVAPGVRVGDDSVLVLGAVALHDTSSGGIYAGNPATRVRDRKITPIGTLSNEGR